MSLVHTRNDPLECFEFLVEPRNPARRRKILSRVQRKPKIEAIPKTAALPKVKPVEAEANPKVKEEPSTYWVNEKISGSLDSYCFGQHSKMSRAEKSLREIMREVAEKYNVSIMDMKSARRFKYLVIPRQEFFYRARMETTKSLPAIGRFCGNRDHTTVYHGVNKHASKLKSEQGALAA